MNHTPHKWILDEDGEPFIYQLNKAGTNLFYLNVQDGVIDTGERTSKAQLRSIAEFIYTSCNAHEELVATLKAVLHHNDALKNHYKLPNSLVRQIENAIAKAEGKETL